MPKYGINGENWHLISPTGEHYIFNCLRNWLRTDGANFFDLPPEKLCHVFYSLKSRTKKGTNCDYKGWTVVLDTEQKRKTRRFLRHIKIGEIYGSVKIISEANANGKPKRYIAVCTKCGHKSEMGTQEIFANKTGCISCYLKERSDRLQREAESHIGEKHGTLTITDVFLTYRRKEKITIWGAKCRCDCGAVEDYILSDVVADFVRCKICNSNNQPMTINGIQKRGKKFYCRINYRYYSTASFCLGTYDSYEDAKRIKDIANSKKESGNFLIWYKKAFPKYWAKIEKKYSSQE